MFLRNSITINFINKLTIIMTNNFIKKIKKFFMPPERFELSTPGLQDQCSNPWAMEATSWNVKIKFVKDHKLEASVICFPWSVLNGAYIVTWVIFWNLCPLAMFLLIFLWYDYDSYFNIKFNFFLDCTWRRHISI